MNDRIKKVRRELDLTQQEFADRIGVKRGAIANYEIGRNTPVDSVISLICREFNVSEAWLRTGEGDMFIPEPSDELESIAKQYGLSNDDYILLKRFVSLSPEERAVITRFVSGVSSNMVDTTESAEEAYRKSLGIAQSTGSTASNTTEGTEKIDA